MSTEEAEDKEALPREHSDRTSTKSDDVEQKVEMKCEQSSPETQDASETVETVVKAEGVSDPGELHRPVHSVYPADGGRSVRECNAAVKGMIPEPEERGISPEEA